MADENETIGRLTASVEALQSELSKSNRRSTRIQFLLGGVLLVMTSMIILSPGGPLGIGAVQAQTYAAPGMPYRAWPVKPKQAEPQARAGSTDRARVVERALQTLDASSEFNGDAATVVFLSDIARDLGSLPELRQELRNISRKLDANTHLANEMRELNLKMTTITHSIDSTMGTMGRLMNQMLLYYYYSY